MGIPAAQQPPALAGRQASRLAGHRPSALAGPQAAIRAGDDNWPHTKRLLPWMLAGFITMVFVVPFNGIIFKVHLPANATPDRLFLVLMVGVMCFKRMTEGRRRARWLTPVEVAVLIFGGIALLSLVVNIDRIYQQGQLGSVEKALSQLLAYGVFFFVVIATVRPAEMGAYARLIMGLACVTALGTIYEANTGYNVFYIWSSNLLHPLASVAPSPTSIHTHFGNPPTIVGPTQHGLALASMLTMALPFAVLPLLESGRTGGQRVRYLIVIGLILAASLSTTEKTAMLAPIAAFMVLARYKRQLLRLVPIAIIALIPVIHFAAPGALGGLENLIPGANQTDYTDGRAGDYAAVAPDILSHVVIGRGYGTLDPQNWRVYRILDNQYLDEVFGVGMVGLIAYLAIIAGALGTAHAVIKEGGKRAPPTLAAAAGCAAFGLVSATYDAMGYPEAAYSFLFVAGIIAVAAGERRQLLDAAAARVAGGHQWARSRALKRSGSSGAGRSRNGHLPGEPARSRAGGGGSAH
jgi:O-antigen ligase